LLNAKFYNIKIFKISVARVTWSTYTRIVEIQLIVVVKDTSQLAVALVVHSHHNMYSCWFVIILFNNHHWILLCKTVPFVRSILVIFIPYSGVFSKVSCNVLLVRKHVSYHVNITFISRHWVLFIVYDN